MDKLKPSVFTLPVPQPKHLAAGLLTEESRATPERRREKISLFGNFGLGNLGNESTFQAILYHLRLLVPAADFTCICTGPEAITATHNVRAVPSNRRVVKAWNPKSRLARVVRGLTIGIASELYRWIDAFITLRGTDTLIVPGTGLLTDAYGLMNNWGPYNVFKWSLMAKVSGSRLLFVSVGVGPLSGRISRFLVKSSLAMADYRSYRDTSALDYLKGIGFVRNADRVYPDLAFSLPEILIPHTDAKTRRRTVVGVGLIHFAGMYNVEKPSNGIYEAYLETFTIFVKWLLAHDYDVRLLIGDTCDSAVTHDFRCLLHERLSMCDADRVIDEPAISVGDLLSQLEATDIVVATRFHNVLLALLLNKPVISISFHHKCASLMRQMGLSDYCQDINDLNADRLIDQFCQLEKNAGRLRPMIRQKAEEYRKALDDQYNLLFQDFGAHANPSSKSNS
jgi:polysaccharide pyruvyl transferase WcaK-like protein